MAINHRRIYDEIIWPHFDNLIRLTSKANKVKELKHYWELGIEKNFPAWIYISSSGSDLMARIAFRVGGLRDKFYSYLDEDELERLLKETLEMSFKCYKEYQDTPILKQIREYCADIDKSMGKNFLTLDLKKIKIYRDFAIQRLKVKLLNFFLIPKRGIKISLIKNDKEIKSLKTDRRGNVMFENLPKGKYLVRISSKKQLEFIYIVKYIFGSKIVWLKSL